MRKSVFKLKRDVMYFGLTITRFLVSSHSGSSSSRPVLERLLF